MVGSSLFRETIFNAYFENDPRLMSIDIILSRFVKI